MKLDSDYFDMIRVKPRKSREAKKKSPPCAHDGCKEPGTHPAPIGRCEERTYLYFCLKHVREYNRSYNYFNGMDEDSIASYLKQNEARNPSARPREQRTSDNPYMQNRRKNFSDSKANSRTARKEKGNKRETRRPVVRNMERKSFQILDLEIHASSVEIKTRYKELVKRHHPDVNGGDPASEQKLREIIQAYSYLKDTGFC